MSTAPTAESTLEVVLAHSAGTCFGVQAAIDIAEEQRKPILGPLVHNPKIVGDLAAEGIPILERYTDMHQLKEEGMTEVIITAHGYPKQLKESLLANGIKFHDATCPVLLKWVYKKIEAFDNDGCNIIIIGNPEHAEIIASRTYGRDIHAVYSEQEIDALPDGLENVVAICQTTITKDKFEKLVDYMRTKKYPNLRAIDTRCKPVKNQQEGVERLAQWVDAMIIIGGYNSSNTTNLARLSKKYLPATTYHIDDVKLVDPRWLQEIKFLGLGAGTSTPQTQIAEVQQRITQIYPGKVVFHSAGKTTAEEAMAAS